MICSILKDLANHEPMERHNKVRGAHRRRPHQAPETTSQSALFGTGRSLRDRSVRQSGAMRLSAAGGGTGSTFRCYRQRGTRIVLVHAQ
jgi:hypothetical protein